METVYLVPAALLRDEALAGRVYACCPPARRAQLEAVRDPKAQLRSLAASAALMLALRDAGLQPEEAGLALTAAGKPYLPAQPGIHISLSHSGGLAVCAAGDRPLGVDIERPRTFRSSLLRRCFSEAERAAAEPLRLWVLKESFVKWTGEGLSACRGAFCALKETPCPLPARRPCSGTRSCPVGTASPSAAEDRTRWSRSSGRQTGVILGRSRRLFLILPEGTWAGRRSPRETPLG